MPIIRSPECKEIPVGLVLVPRSARAGHDPRPMFSGSLRSAILPEQNMESRSGRVLFFELDSLLELTPDHHGFPASSGTEGTPRHKGETPHSMALLSHASMSSPSKVHVEGPGSPKDGLSILVGAQRAQQTEVRFSRHTLR